MMKKYILLLFIAAFTIKANAQNEFQLTAKGTQYRIVNANAGDKIKLNQIVTFQIVQKTGKDSVLFSTYTMGHPVQAQIQAEGDLMDVFPLLTVNDSVIVKVPTDSIFKAQEDKRPPFLPKGSDMFFALKIERVQSLDEVIAERDKAVAEGKAVIAKFQEEESANINKYIAAHKLIFKATASGLKYKITKPAVKRKPLPGDTVLVNYTGRTLDGKVFDSSVEADVIKAGLQQPGRAYEPYSLVVAAGQVIPGWDEGLQLLNEGSKATFIIPSKLAYGERGFGEDIKPFSTLLFDVTLVKVKPAKHAPVAKATVKKAPVKAVAKKVVVKKPLTPPKPAVKH